MVMLRTSGSFQLCFTIFSRLFEKHFKILQMFLPASQQKPSDFMAFLSWCVEDRTQVQEDVESKEF